MKLYYPCWECKHRYGIEYTSECDTKCDYAKVAKEKKQLKEKNKHLYGVLLEHRICPECGEHMSFYIEGSFGGSLGVFECGCGYRDSNYANTRYATDKDWERFEKDSEGIMW